MGTERFWDGDAWTEESRWPGTDPFTAPVPNDLPAPGADGSLEPEVPRFRPIMTGMPHESTVGFWLPPTDSLVPAHLKAPPPPSRRRRGLKAASMALAIILVAGGSFLIFGRHTSADAAVSAAVNSSLSNRTADLVISGSGGTAAGKFTISGTGAIDFGDNTLQMTANVSAGSEQLTEQEVYLNGVAYLNIGNELSAILPGKSWVSLDLSQLTRGSTSSSLGTTDSLGSDPAAVLRALSEGGNTATDLGPSTINNASVEGYEVHIDAAALQERIAQANLPSWLQQAMHEVSNPSVDYNVYVNGSGLLAAMTVDTTETVSGHTVTSDITLDFSDYGVPVNVTAPPADEVAPFQSLLQAAESSNASTN